MIKIFFKLFCTGVSLVFIFYLVLPNPDFPIQLPDAYQSELPGDNETLLRRGYFTNYTRDEVLDFYQRQFSNSSFLNIPLPTYRLNYPPEEAQTLIRDQTQSTFLEEIVHPLRESIYVNGFEPKDPQYDVWYKGVDFRQKVIIRMVPSSLLVRLFVAAGILASVFVLTKEWKDALK